MINSISWVHWNQGVHILALAFSFPLFGQYWFQWQVIVPPLAYLYESVHLRDHSHFAKILIVFAMLVENSPVERWG